MITIALEVMKDKGCEHLTIAEELKAALVRRFQTSEEAPTLRHD